MEQENQVAAPGFAAEHPELYHYTDRGGLLGILDSNTLWATHFSHLNDSTEVMLLKQSLTEALASRVGAPIDNSLNRHARRAVARVNLNQATPELRIFVDAAFEVAFKGFMYEADSRNIEALAEPFITSFCSHPPAQSYERKNGLLSQWRAYGGRERYCIVLDTAKMIDLLSREGVMHYWIGLHLVPILYKVADLKIDTHYSTLLTECEQAYIRFYRGIKVDLSEAGQQALLSTAPRFKHEGFREEQEVRVIAIPGKPSMADKIRLAHPEAKLAQLKAIRSRAGDAGECPYLALFDCLQTTLPIKRIIVGPSKNQDDNLAAARSLIKNKFPLSCSATPFIG